MKKLISSAAVLGSGLLGASPALASLNDNVDIRTNIRYNALANIKPSQYVTAAINLILGAAGVVAFIFLLWGGVQWILAGGDKEGTEKARKRITSALIGLAIVFSAYALIFIVQALFGISIISVNLSRIGT